jgi:hypothetical protein
VYFPVCRRGNLVFLALLLAMFKEDSLIFVNCVQTAEVAFGNFSNSSPRRGKP